MAEIIGFCNQKGGVGKTTSAINLAAWVAAAEKKTLLVDFDPQCNTTSGLGFYKNKIKSSTYDLIMARDGLTPLNTSLPYLDLLPATPDLVGAEVELVPLPNREGRLGDGLARFRSDYDYIFIDSPPSLGLLTVNVLAASRYLIVPVQCEYYALEGLSDLIRTIGLVRGGVNPDLEIGGIVLTMYDARNNLCHEVEAEIRRHFGDSVFRTTIPRNVRLSEAPSHGKPVLLYDVKSRGAQSYLELAQEFLERIGREKSVVEEVA